MFVKPRSFTGIRPIGQRSSSHILRRKSTVTRVHPRKFIKQTEVRGPEVPLPLGKVSRSSSVHLEQIRLSGEIPISTPPSQQYELGNMQVTDSKFGCEENGYFSPHSPASSKLFPTPSSTSPSVSQCNASSLLNNQSSNSLSPFTTSPCSPYSPSPTPLRSKNPGLISTATIFQFPPPLGTISQSLSSPTPDPCYPTEARASVTSPVAQLKPSQHAAAALALSSMEATADVVLPTNFFPSLPSFIYKYHFPDPPRPPEHLLIKEPAPEEGARERVLQKVNISCIHTNILQDRQLKSLIVNKQVVMFF